MPRKIQRDCWKVRVCVKGCGFVHLLSFIEPTIILHPEHDTIDEVRAEWVDGTEHGDTLGFIDWREVTAVTWRAAKVEVESPAGNQQEGRRRLV